MLERMQLRNFQGHEDLRVVFDERITTFVGPSDTGKSSILRALKWGMTNRPSGSAFVRHDDDKLTASVSLWLDEHRLSRRKGKGSVNELVVDGVKLEAFGSELPEPVQELCNVDGVNFQGQHDSPFWLSLNAGQASRELNAVVNLDEIDRVLSLILKMERRTKTEAELCEKRMKEAEQDSKDLVWVFGMEVEWQETTKKKKQLDNMEWELEQSRELLREVNRLRRLAEVEVPDTSELDVLIAEQKRAEEKVKMTKSMLREVHRLRDQVGEFEKEVDSLQTRLSSESGGMCPLCGGVLKC